MTNHHLDNLKSRPNRATTPDLQYVAPGVWALRNVFVNLFFVRQEPSSGPWVLVDAGLPGAAGKIRHAAETLFGEASRPEAIIMTHGHFDHAGALKTLAEHWDVPVYAHRLELPYLTGRSSYPPPDPTVGGGAMAVMSVLYPKAPYDLGNRVHELPADGSVPQLPGWRWLHTPGHTPGHVSFFRESDRLLLVGDAFVTVEQESAIAVWEQRQEVHGPPKYFTCDWQAARSSVEMLAQLKPAIAATGHGVAMRGDALQQELEQLAREFDRLAVPAHGRYVSQPARADESGVVSVPPPVLNPRTPLLVGATAAVVGLAAYAILAQRRNGSNKHLKRRKQNRMRHHHLDQPEAYVSGVIDPFAPTDESDYNPYHPI
ncbi:MBL fold metallo-hydrolase [Hymenobacter oligotrophus]|uniref:MBL fold metallo-hydrolase n=1 Tax=Hymenobacter oligotrophus TaxID=2319843 RepID=A0A3B7R7X0_9BACT|nr:MBL fold metallo-hydrolase [Hymenobacter oligotrophus]AYA35756.1 MBL fold metallo-hydrolase [Hymenobacter oligotrophus]